MNVFSVPGGAVSNAGDTGLTGTVWRSLSIMFCAGYYSSVAAFIWANLFGLHTRRRWLSLADTPR